MRTLSVLGVVVVSVLALALPAGAPPVRTSGACPVETGASWRSGYSAGLQDGANQEVAYSWESE